MSRINTNVAALTARRVIGYNDAALSASLERLSTGLRINRGGDDPAGLIISENLRAEARGVATAIDNAERADQFAAIAESGLVEISDMLAELRGLIAGSASDASVSLAERNANQLRVDSILQTIDRVASSTSFQGTRLLNGGFDYDIEGVSDAALVHFIHAAKIEPGNTLDVTVAITQSTQVAALELDWGGGGALDLGGAGVDDPAARFVFEISGPRGRRELTFASGASFAFIADTINTFTSVTGVQAQVTANGVRVDTSDSGDEQFVRIRTMDDGDAVGAGIVTYNDDDNNTTGGVGSETHSWISAEAQGGCVDHGQDVGASINGIAATVVDGIVASIDTDFLSMQVVIHPGYAQTHQSVKLMQITGGGATFQLAGRAGIGGSVPLGIHDLSTRSIGTTPLNDMSAELRTLNAIGAGREFNVVDGDITRAQESIDTAIIQVSEMRGRLGAFQRNIVGATIRSLGVALGNTVSAESVVRDSDFAGETAQLTRTQILSSSATQTLSVASSIPQSVLTLLG